MVRKAFSHVRNSAILVYGIPEQVRGGSFQAGSCWRLGSSWHISQQMGSCLWGSQHPFSEWEVLSHDRDRSIFARGAARAAEWLIGRNPGRYTMRDVLEL